MTVEDESPSAGACVACLLGCDTGSWTQDVTRRVTHRTPRTYDFADARCPLAYNIGSRCGLDALVGAPLVSLPPEATPRTTIVHALLQRCCRWAA
jgi:hypothetical protein